jgi:hypothetical protein
MAVEIPKITKRTNIRPPLGDNPAFKDSKEVADLEVDHCNILVEQVRNEPGVIIQGQADKYLSTLEQYGFILPSRIELSTSSNKIEGGVRIVRTIEYITNAKERGIYNVQRKDPELIFSRNPNAKDDQLEEIGRDALGPEEYVRLEGVMFKKFDELKEDAIKKQRIKRYVHSSFKTLKDVISSGFKKADQEKAGNFTIICLNELAKLYDVSEPIYVTKHDDESNESIIANHGYHECIRLAPGLEKLEVVSRKGYVVIEEDGKLFPLSEDKQTINNFSPFDPKDLFKNDLGLNLINAVKDAAMAKLKVLTVAS